MLISIYIDYTLAMLSVLIKPSLSSLMTVVERCVFEFEPLYEPR